MSHEINQRQHSTAKYKSYIIGFLLSIITTVVAYALVVNNVWSTDKLTYVILAIAVVQLAVQMVFFLHLGQGSRWKAATFYFTLLVVLIIVIGTIWIMNNLDYNMMHMSPDEMKAYMHKNQGI